MIVLLSSLALAAPLPSAWQQATVSAMAGRDAPPAYRDVANRMHAQRVLDEAGAAPLVLLPGERERIVDLALSGAGVGLQEIVLAAVSRSRASGLVRVTDAVRGNALRVGPDETLHDGVDAAPPRRSSLTVGSGLRMTGDDETWVRPTAAGWMQARHLGPSLVRLEVAAGVPGIEEGLPLRTTTTRVRQDLGRAAFVVADLRLREGTELDRARAAVVVRTAPRWTAELAGLRRFEGDEWRADLVLRSHLPWEVPFRGPTTAIPAPPAPDAALFAAWRERAAPVDRTLVADAGDTDAPTLSPRAGSAEPAPR